jgi:hypothetical protein
MKTLVIIISLLSFNWLLPETPTISENWKKEALKNFQTYIISDTKELYSYDFSSILHRVSYGIANTNTYTGVFGPKNRRIDFYLTFEKKNINTYKVKGKSKLGDNIREISGEVQLLEAVKLNLAGYRSPAHIVWFEYKLNEPGNRDGDGCFIGIGSIVFTIEDGKPKALWSESGDLREYNNMFVGVWNRYNSDVSRECIFNFFPSGLYNKLPYRDNLYIKDEDSEYNRFKIRDEFEQSGWENYRDNKSGETKWWED